MLPRLYNADIEFSETELMHFGPYKTGDTIYFESNHGDIDTIAVMEIWEEKIIQGCFMARRPVNYKSINIKYLPIDSWHGITYSDSGKKKINYQSVISIEKQPINKAINYNIRFKEFSYKKDSILGEMKKESIINGISIYNCYLITHNYLRANATAIDTLYWTDNTALLHTLMKVGKRGSLKLLKL